MRTSVRIVKRVVDVAASVLGLLGAAPLFGAVALAIKLTSPGPLIYRQRRAGMIRDAVEPKFEEFWCYKFRTMIPDAESATGAVLAQEGDPRVTPVGMMLRRTRLDELPQLFNVLRGDMSLVGPRPERPELIHNLALAIPYFDERMRLVKPGLTGLAQVHLSYTGRMPPSSALAGLKGTLVNPFDLQGLEDSEADDMRTKMLYDFAYAASLEHFWEFLRTDVGIIVRTPLVMFFAPTGH